jgi:hypothetical protein
MKTLQPKGLWKFRWEMPSDSSPGTTYVVAMDEHGEWGCGCNGWRMHFPRNDCKHIRRVKQVEPRVDAGGLELKYSAEGRRTIRKPAPVIAPRALTNTQVRDIERELRDGGPQRFSKPSPQKPEPFFVRQTRRAITLED